MTDSPEESLRKAIAGEEAQLGRLDAQRAKVLSRVRGLREQLEQILSGQATGGLQSAEYADRAGHRSTAEKLALLRARFRGREDVFAKRWENSKSGRSGYAPACSNEWVRGICDKPRVRCGECRQQSFLPLDGEVILDHFRGRHVVGVYPLLRDETCCFLAADFDGSS